MAEIPYVYTKFKIDAEIAGQKFDDIVAISATFGLNTIPTASLTMAVGHDARSGRTKEATIHSLRKKIKPRDNAKVWLTINPEAGKISKMEIGRFLIFEGMVAGIGYQRSHNSANYVVQLIHWLDDMNNSSALNGKWFQNAPFLMATNASFVALQTTEGTTHSSVPVIDANEELITKAHIQKDMWAEVIKPIFKKIAEWPLTNSKTNDAALEALKRMPNGEPTGPQAAGVQTTPLALDVTDLPGYNIELSVRTALTKDALDSFAYTSFWGKLVGEYAPQFFFAVSPSVEHACVIPFFGGLQHDGNQKYVIKGDEYSYANFNASLSQLIDSVVVFWPSQLDPMLGVGGEMSTTDRYTQPAGQWPPKGGAERQGLKLFKDLPAWLTNMSPWPIFSAATTSVNGKRGGCCLSPGTGEKKQPPNWFLPSDIAEAMSDKVCTRFAEHFYKTEFLSQRYGELSGKLRFDIAPGSIVKIEMPTTEIQSDGAMIGAVTQVSYAINAERALAGTSFALSYLRTEEEDKDTVLISKEYAPLYVEGTKWPGGPLRKPE